MYKAGLYSRVGQCVLAGFLIALNTLTSISALGGPSVNLAWDPSASTNVAGYNVYYGVASGIYTNVVPAGNVTNTTISGLASNTIYYFAATAYDSNGIESDFSVETNYITSPLLNYPPTLNPIANLTIYENAGQQTINLTGITSGSSNEFQNLTVMAWSGNQGLIPNPGVIYVSPNTSATLKFTPTPLSNGTATITVVVNDGGSQYGSFSRNFVVTVLPVNQAPTLNPIADMTVNENAGLQTVALSGIGSGAPNEAQNLLVTATSGSPAIVPNPSVIYSTPNTMGTLKFTPVANASGSALITVTVNDGQSTNNLFSRNFTVTVGASRPPPTNTPPVISAIANQSTTQDVAIVAIPFTIGDQETPAANLVVSGKSSNLTLIPNANITFGGSGSSRNVTITPAAGKGGTANITITVSDGTASTSATFQVAVQAITSQAFTLTQEGQGTVSPALTPKITAGRTYTLTAKPAAGQEFAGWTGSIVSDSPKISFKATSNIVLHAKFVVSPFIPILGTYNGLFNESSEVAQNSSGNFSITVGNHGVYSGRVQLGASRMSFTGKLNLQCTSTNSLKRKLLAPLALQLRVGTNSEIDQIFGQLSDSTWTAALTGDRARFNSKTNPAPFAGNYTLIIPGQSGDSSKPAGYSYGTVKVATSGMTIFAGTLADGTKVSQSTAVSKNGAWPFYASLYAGQGSLMSWLTFADQASDDLSGTLNWIKLPVANSHYYAGGFTSEVMASGSTYVKPASSDDLVINISTGLVSFSGGNLNPDFANSISVGPGNHVTDESGNKLTMAFSVANGLYKGAVVDPASGKTMPFAGAVHQKAGMGYGSLMGANQSSSAIISP